MPKTTANIRIEIDLKRQAEDLFSELGLTFSSACILFLTQAVREQRIPFMVSANASSKEIITAVEEGPILKRELTPEEEKASIEAFMDAEAEKMGLLHQPLE